MSNLGANLSNRVDCSSPRRAVYAININGLRLAGAGGLEPTTLGFGGVGYLNPTSRLRERDAANLTLGINGLAREVTNLHRSNMRRK